MKKIIAGLVFGLFVAVIGAQAALAVSVKGYYKSNGTYVQPYNRTSPNKSLFDNYSTKGNYNPYSGKAGTVNPYKVPTYTAPKITVPSYKAPTYKYTAPTYKYSVPTYKVPTYKYTAPTYKIPSYSTTYKYKY